jgi:hypothetical protein
MSPATAGLIIDDVVTTVLDIAVSAWPNVCQGGRVSPKAKEDDITDRFRWEMVAEKERRDPRPQLRFEREVQLDDPENRHPRGFIDVHVGYSWNETNYLAMECKKVTNRHERRAGYYVREGVCRFSTGKYSLGHPYGAMIAYVLRGTPEAAAQFVSGKVLGIDTGETRLDAAWGWQVERRFGNVPNLYSTRHGQAGTHNVLLLLHLFLAFPHQN